MFNHVMVGSNDIERSKRFYDAVLGVLGAGEPMRHEAGTCHVRLFYQHDGSLFGVTQPINDSTGRRSARSRIASSPTCGAGT